MILVTARPGQLGVGAQQASHQVAAQAQHHVRDAGRHRVVAGEVEQPPHQEQADDHDGHQPQRVVQAFLEARIDQFLEQRRDDGFNRRTDREEHERRDEHLPVRLAVRKDLASGLLELHALFRRVLRHGEPL
jgi:hypothetical protein